MTRTGAVVLIFLLTGCATAKRWGSLTVEDARAIARARPSARTLLAAGAVVASTALDETVRDAARASTKNTAGEIAAVVEPFGGRYSDRVMAGFLLAGLARDDSRMKAVAFDSFISSLVASKGVTPLLKRAIDRERPNGGPDSFPSNHATQAFAVASVVAAHYDSAWIDGLAYGVATLVGASRIYHDDHWLSDVVAGGIIGTATGRLIVRTNNRARSTWTVMPIYDGKRRGIAISVSSSTRPSSPRSR